MKIYKTEEIRNIVLMGNSSSGKTTLSEAMLYVSGMINRKGDVQLGNTVSDFNEVEIHNKCSIFSSLLYSEYKNKKINIIDTAGLFDFNNTIHSSLKVVDSAIMLINAQNGVEVGTQVQMRYIDKVKKPLAIVINQLDHEKANLEQTMESMQNFFGNKLLFLQLPDNTGSKFSAILDILKNKLYKYKDEEISPSIEVITDEYQDIVGKYREKLYESIAETDESLMEKYFQDGVLSEEELIKGLKKAFLEGLIYPVFCISAKKNIGVNVLMDYILELFPNPYEGMIYKTVDGREVKININEQPSVFIFKTSNEPHIGEINYFRVITGEIYEGIDLVNNNNQTKERFNQILISNGKNRTKVEKIVAGDLGCTVKLRNTKYNHTLSVPNFDIVYEGIEFPEPRHRMAIRALNEAEEEKLAEVLNKYRNEDPTIVVEYSKELKQIIVHCQGDYHLNILKWHLDNVYKVGSEFVLPKIPYRETITKPAYAWYRHKKQTGGAGQFGEVHLVIEPYIEGVPNTTKFKFPEREINLTIRNVEEYDLPWGGKLVYYNCIVGGAIDARFMPSILKGIMEKMEEGPLTGSYARDIRVAVFDGKMHPVDSNDISFRLAGRNAFKEAFKKAAPRILEPIYELEVWVPTECLGDVISDLQTRRAILLGINNVKGFEVVKAKVPLAELYNYSTALNSLTSGRAMYFMKFSEYVQVPMEIQEKLIKEFEAKQQEEE